MTNILTSNTAKQVFGAVGGMAIATVLYLGVDQASYTSIKGMLVTTKTMSPSAEISINANDVDEATLRRITSRAGSVAAALGSSQSALQAETPLTENASSRRATRQFAVQLKQLVSSADTVATTTLPVIHESAGALPDSGLGLNLLVLLTLAFAFATSKTTWRRACTSFVTRFVIR